MKVQRVTNPTPAANIWVSNLREHGQVCSFQRSMNTDAGRHGKESKQTSGNHGGASFSISLSAAEPGKPCRAARLAGSRLEPAAPGTTGGLLGCDIRHLHTPRKKSQGVRRKEMNPNYPRHLLVHLQPLTACLRWCWALPPRGCSQGLGSLQGICFCQQVAESPSKLLGQRMKQFSLCSAYQGPAQELS